MRAARSQLRGCVLLDVADRVVELLCEEVDRPECLAIDPLLVVWRVWRRPCAWSDGRYGYVEPVGSVALRGDSRRRSAPDSCARDVLAISYEITWRSITDRPITGGPTAGREEVAGLVVCRGIGVWVSPWRRRHLARTHNEGAVWTASRRRTQSRVVEDRRDTASISATDH